MSVFLEKLRKMKRTDAIIILLAGVLILIAAVPAGSAAGGDDSDTLEEEKSLTESELESVLTQIEGAGKVRVMISFSDEECTAVQGVAIVAQGGDSPQVESRIREVVMSLFPVEAHKVVVVKMSGQEE